MSDLKATGPEVRAATKWLKRRDYQHLLTGRMLADFCKSTGIGFQDGWDILSDKDYFADEDDDANGTTTERSG